MRPCSSVASPLSLFRAASLAHPSLACVAGTSTTMFRERNPNSWVRSTATLLLQFSQNLSCGDRERQLSNCASLIALLHLDHRYYGWKPMECSSQSAKDVVSCCCYFPTPLLLSVLLSLHARVCCRSFSFWLFCIHLLNSLRKALCSGFLNPSAQESV